MSYTKLIFETIIGSVASWGESLRGMPVASVVVELLSRSIVRATGRPLNLKASLRAAASVVDVVELPFNVAACATGVTLTHPMVVVDISDSRIVPIRVRR